MKPRVHEAVLREHSTAYQLGQAYARQHPPLKTRFQAAQEAAETAYASAEVAEQGHSRQTFVVVFLAGWLSA